MMRHRRTSAGQALGRPYSITGGSAAILLAVDDQNRRAVQTDRQVIPEWRQRRNRMAPASSPGRVRSRAAAIMAPLEKPIAMGALESLYCVLAASMKSARITAREAMSASSIDRSAKRWKNANPPSNGMPPRTARIGDPGAKSAASGTSSCSLPPEPCSRTSGGPGWVGASDEVVGV